MYFQHGLQNLMLPFFQSNTCGLLELIFLLVGLTLPMSRYLLDLAYLIITRLNMVIVVLFLCRDNRQQLKPLSVRI